MPGDISSAAFFIVAACIQPGSKLTISGVGINTTRMGVINILQLMGGKITMHNQRQDGYEPIADIVIEHSQLIGVDIPADQVSLAIDEFPVIFIAAALASGTTRLTNASELRVKESDRLAAMANGIVAIGGKANLLDDGIVIEGQPKLQGGNVDSLGDHRIAMAFAVAALGCNNPVHIKDTANVTTSFPDFVALANRVGLAVV